MKFKTLCKRLAAEAEAAGICREWREKILTAPSREYLIQLFIKGLDFAILNDFPSNGLAAEFDDIAPAFGIFINREGTWRADNKKRVIARDATVTPASFGGFDVGEVYALHGAAVQVQASGYAIVNITVLPGAQLEVIADGPAQVKIFDRGGQVKTTGTAKIKIITP